MDVKDAPKGEIKMNSNQKKPKDQGKNNKGGNNKFGNKKVDDSDPEVSFDVVNTGKKLDCKCLNCSKCFEELRSHFNLQLKLIRTEYDAKIDTLHRIVEKKDETIGQLQKDIGEIQQTCSYLTRESTDLNKKVETNVTTTTQKIEVLEEKTSDLEDRSRRNNLVFFGIPEIGDQRNVEKCEVIITQILIQHGIISQDIANQRELFDRAHRLGPRRRNQDRPRPIIVRVTYYKDKEYILSQGYKFKDSAFNVSEDFSKPTLTIRRTLVSKAKSAKTACPQIKSFKLNYRHLVLQYECDGNNGKYTYHKSFDLKDTQDPNWYLPRPRSENSRTDSAP